MQLSIPEWELRLQSEHAQARRCELARFRLADSLEQTRPARRWFDSAVLRLAEGAQRRRREASEQQAPAEFSLE
ncbi:hypothetical protein AYO38_04080 [bacterium SCGC AG-212-C10]|nr:hypothetical protein AYO38_04080 [bacterium SCGC AG-212-C10]